VFVVNPDTTATAYEPDTNGTFHSLLLKAATSVNVPPPAPAPEPEPAPAVENPPAA
jgi:hypothetical protein